MNRFTVDFSSSPASERLPSNSPQQQRRNVFSVPDDPASTTPAAPPPTQLFGSSQFGSGISKLQFSKRSNAIESSAPRSQTSQRTNYGTQNLPKSRLFEMSTNTYATEEDEDYADEMTDDEEIVPERNRDGQPTKNTAQSLLKFSTNSMRQSLQQSTNRRPTRPSKSQLPRKGRYDFVIGLSRDISRRMGTATLSEPDDIILATEDLLRTLEAECQQQTDENSIRSMSTAAAQELVAQWTRRSRHRSSPANQSSVGPDPKSSPFEKAQYLATLLFELHHHENVTIGSESLMMSEDHDQDSRSMPEVLLDWLDNYHINYEPLFDQVIGTTPAPSANDLYWDAIETFTLRGKFAEVMELLRKGDLNYAVIDTPDGSQSANFTGTQLQQAEDAVYRARQLINTCPAFQSGDWNLGGQDWDVYRKQLEAEIEHLAERVVVHDDNPQSSEDLGLFSKPTAKSGLPFIIYQRLKIVYSIMLGDAEEIMGLAQDWVEASMLLTVWWTLPNDKSVAKWSFDVSRANDPVQEHGNPYLQRLSDSFLCTTDPDSQSGLQFNTMDAVEVGLGAILQGDLQSCLRILQSLSLCAASAVAEIGTVAGWFTSTSSSTGLDEDDLMVLNYGSNDTPIQKDDLQEKYARSLFERPLLHAVGGGEVEGWELAFSILSRLDDQERMHDCISEMLQNLPVTDQERAAKLVEICEQFGLEAEGRRVSENFADSLVNDTTEYGIALLCYARAHTEHKVRQLVDLLNSYCLVQSKAYPPEGEMDSALSQLVGSPITALQSIADADPRAAEILQFHLVGYACLRRFYSLRDDQLSRAAHLRPLAKRKAAAKALIAAISSAADSIYGGLYDPERQSAIQVDGLLTLLGEATEFLGHTEDDRILSSDQLYTLLAAIEDLQTVNDRVYQAAEECMEAALRNYHGSLPPSPHAMLKKSVSSGTNSNFSFSMMGSEMLARSEDSLGGKSLGSAVIIGKNGNEEVRRGWDWRAKFKDTNTTGVDIIKHLRMRIASELSIATIEEGVM